MSKLIGVCSIALCLTAPVAAQAQESPQPPTVQVVWPARQPRPEAGKSAVYDGEADAGGVMFAIPAGTVFSRSTIVIKRTSGNAPLTVRLRNDLSNQWDRTETTDANGFLLIKYRTEGTATLLVQSEGRQKFQVGFFQGVEIPVHKWIAPFLTPQAAAQGRAPGASSPASSTSPAQAATPGVETAGTPVVMWLIAGLLGVLVMLGGVLVFRRRR
jgi:hypothetical protein